MTFGPPDRSDARVPVCRDFQRAGAVIPRVMRYGIPILLASCPAGHFGYWRRSTRIFFRWWARPDEQSQLTTTTPAAATKCIRQRNSGRSLPDGYVVHAVMVQGASASADTLALFFSCDAAAGSMSRTNKPRTERIPPLPPAIQAVPSSRSPSNRLVLSSVGFSEGCPVS
jgi:hypothetical protein